MKRITLLLVIAAAMVSVIGCGGPTQTATEEPAQPPVTETQGQPANTEAPAITETASISGTQVDITLTDNKIASSMTAFQVGVPYTFVITNAGHRGHNFNISTPVPAGGSFEDAVATALLAVDVTQLAAGNSVTVDFTFPESAADAILEFACLIRNHYRNGMFLPITVTR
jgi:uncharacterized cupredoxin-like copper-binding protein